MMHKQKLLDRYLRKQCSREELQQLFDVLREDSSADYQEVMDAIWEELTIYPLLEKSTSESMYTTIRKQTAAQESQSGRVLTLRHRFFHPSLRVAAAFVGVFLSAFVLYMLLNNHDQVVHQTEYGQTTTVELPDHSVITLNGNTQISYADTWKEDQPRELWIEGEAYFSVQHTKNNQKFIVHANHLDIEVLGTEFNVNNRSGNTKVMLSSGKIRLNDTQDERLVDDVIMQPGQYAELTRDRTFELKSVNPKRYTSWKNKELVFDHTPMTEVVQMIENTYGLEVIIQHDDIKNRKLTGLLPSQDIDMLLNMLSDIFQLKVTRQDNQVFIDEK